MEKMALTQFMTSKISKDWKEIEVLQKNATTRMGYLPIGGGALNASYTTVDAVANISATAGNLGMIYGRDFIWSHSGFGGKNSDDETIVLLVKEEKYESFLHLAVTNKHRIQHGDQGDIWISKVA